MNFFLFDGKVLMHDRANNKQNVSMNQVVNGKFVQRATDGCNAIERRFQNANVN